MKEGPILELTTRVHAAVNERIRANEPIWELIQEVRDNKKLNGSERKKLLRFLYSSLSIEDIQEKHVYDAQTYDVGVSYRGGIIDLQRTKLAMRDLGTNIFPGGNPKLKDRAFAASLGVPVPKTYQQRVPLSEVKLVPNSILKPVGGAASKGVFFVDDDLHLHSVVTSTVYPTLSAAKVEIKRFQKSISKNNWIVEQAILSKSGLPANDFKVFAFYGKIGMYLEIDRVSFPSARYATYNENGERIERGGNYKNKVFPGTGIPTRLERYTKTLSLASPIPILRFDFHSGSDGLYLGEITPHPGGTYSGAQNEAIDRMLGKYFADAKARLYIDLLNGKEFPEFRKAYGV